MFKFWVDRDKQLAERFSAAIDHLGNGNVLVRAGAIRELDRVMHGSIRERNRVLQTYADFLRIRTSEGIAPDEFDCLPADVAAVLTALRSRPRVMPKREDPMDLTGIRLRGPVLTGIRLRGVRLAHAELVDADLRDADLTGADLQSARLIRADLRGANLTGALLGAADLIGSNLSHCDLTGATLVHANLFGANLIGAVLTDADLRGVRLGQTRGLSAPSEAPASPEPLAAED
ncbi:pentapeptide repeat-containing protein [Nocardia sp. NPDC059240]|uniref:pentapeptide repeat-containing protein n=1 Tax=Nocardia sp. NPDC059240 TaxID=3346786 RepID=UPI0036B8C4C4